MAAKFLILSLFCVANSEYYDTFTGIEVPKERFEKFQNLSLVPWCAIEVKKCDPREHRRMDNSCNNLRYPTRGAYVTPFHRMLPAQFTSDGGDRLAASGKPLPPVRQLRVDLMSDGRVSSHKYTQMVTNYAVFVTGDITSVHDTVNYVAVTRDCCLPSGRAENLLGGTNRRCAAIPVPSDDVHLRRSNVRCLNLTVPITFQDLGCVSNELPPERINTAAPMLDLSGVYGHEGRGAARGRLRQGGRLRSEIVQGREWPPTGSPLCVNNEPPNETRCHEIPSGGSNSILGLNLLFMWYFRQHNAISRALQKTNPCWDDDQLYYTAREINIAMANQIFYYEYLPEIMGYEYLLQNKVIFKTHGHVNDYDPSLEPRVSVEYVTGTRWFHTIQEGRLKLYTRDGLMYDEKAVVDFTLRTGALAVNNTIEGITQGTFRQPGGAHDSIIDPDMGERVLGRLQFASDVLAADMAKGRLLGMPSYNTYRRHCHLPAADSFEDLRAWMDEEQVQVFARHYKSPEDIDIMAGVIAERSDWLVGPTLGCLMADQLLRWRRADRFWYEHPDTPHPFTPEQLLEIRKMTMSKLVCQYGDGVDKIQPNAFLLPGPGNEIMPCSRYDMPNLERFTDARCAASKHLGQAAANPFLGYAEQQTQKNYYLNKYL